jgi:hypothetical protein
MDTDGHEFLCRGACLSTRAMLIGGSAAPRAMLSARQGRIIFSIEQGTARSTRAIRVNRTYLIRVICAIRGSSPQRNLDFARHDN